MIRPVPPGPPPRPPADLAERPPPLLKVIPGTMLHRIHRNARGAIHFGRELDPARRQRWDAPDGSYGVCYLAFDGHIAFVETMLRDLVLESIQFEDLEARSRALIEVMRPLRLIQMCDQHLRRLGADESVVQGSYDVTWAWSAALHAHPSAPDGIRYRARHDSSGFSVALFERANDGIQAATHTKLSDPSIASELALWLDRYKVGLTS